MSKNKIFLIVISLAVVAIFAVLALKNRPAETYSDVPGTMNVQEEQLSADPELLIRDHSPILGPEDAPVTIVEFLDPECEACRAMYPIVKTLMEEYAGQVRLVIRYMPFHGNSVYAASVLEETRELGKYEEALFQLFKFQPEWGSHHDPKPELIPQLLKQVGIEPSQIEKEMVMEKHKTKVDIDFEDGQKLGVRGTPTFFINGQRLLELGYDPMKAAIEAALPKGP